jgi:hypothetical protein
MSGNTLEYYNQLKESKLMSNKKIHTFHISEISEFGPLSKLHSYFLIG